MGDDQKGFDFDLFSSIIVQKNKNDVYQTCGQELLDLSQKGEIKTQKDRDLAMIAVRTLVSEFAYTSENDLSTFGLDSNDGLDIDECVLICGQKVKDCPKNCKIKEEAKLACSSVP